MLALLALSACTRFDPVGVYEGDATRSGEQSRMVTDLQPDGTMTADTNRFNDTQTGTTVALRRIDDTHLEADLGHGCRVRLDQSPEPNEHSAVVAMTPEQRCPIEVANIRATVEVTGNAELTREAPQTLNLTLHGGTQSGNPDRVGFTNLRYEYSFQGQRQ